MPSKNIKNIPPETGDLHNFGRLTSKLQKDGKVFYQKFRNLGWEYFLLDQQSPLCELLKNKFSNHFIEATFGLRVQLPLTNHMGLVQEVKGISELSELKRTAQTYFTVGQQVAYFTSLGITDLLLENFQITENGLQLIDAECILGFTTNLEESVLLPYTGKIFNGRYGLFPFFFDLEDKTLLAHLIAGYIDGLHIIAEQSSDIITLIDKNLDHFRTLPIRVLLRPTAEYDLFLTESIQPDTDFIEEEITQLNRGDIPYFFKYYGESQVMYYTTDKFDIGYVNLQQLQTAFNTHSFAKPISQILSPARFLILQRNGIQSLCRWGSVGTEFSAHYKNESFELNIEERRIYLKFSHRDEQIFHI
jgi:lantibiotic modifying enzyme